ncbi:MAG: protein-glutamate O-methyltransferase [Firmicutes bacterium]|nr:protein-glutamate O-methyltransferase [Bacillota bacterium]
MSSAIPQKLFQKFSQFIYDELGIKLNDSKRTMLEARLQKRLRVLGLSSFEEYYTYVFSPEGMREELAHMIDVVTTNKTDFFREPAHFDYMMDNALPALVDGQPYGRKKVRVWSAGCSTGEEPYTLSMVLSEFGETCPGFEFSILATDISTRALQSAVRAVYDEQKVQPVPLALKKKYLLRHRDKHKSIVKIIPELRNTITFRRMNFMDNSYDIDEPMHIIFCRNVIIYFDRPTQERLLNRLVSNLVRGGYLFMGHSETLNGMSVPVNQVYPTIYRKP